MRKTAPLVPVILTVLVTAGCGLGADKSDIDSSVVEINKDGTITSTLVDDFSESYYNTDELKSMAEDEISTFNLANGEGSAELLSVDSKGDRVSVEIRYADADSYAHFNSEVFMYMTAAEAQSAGQSLSGSFTDADGNAVSSDSIAEAADEHVIITANKTIVAAPYKIRYVSEGVTLIGAYMADLSGTPEDATSYIILSK